MPQSLSRIWLHMVFSTKGRCAFLQNRELREEMFSMLGAECKKIECPPMRVGGWVDHAHVLCGLARTITVASLVGTIKHETSLWIKQRASGFDDFYWQNGYGAFSVSESLLPKVVDYIERQEEHHQTMSFQDEFRELCRRHGLAIDERYVWD